MKLEGRRAAVVGLGISNIALVRYLVDQGARVTACDRLTAPELGERYRRLEGLPERFVLGQEYLRPLRREAFDLVFLTPGMRKDLPEVDDATDRGARISSEADLFLQHCPGRVLGITGSAGKTTTTALVAALLERFHERVWLGGNIGTPLIDRLDAIQAEDWVVLELSSFQLETVTVGPQVAAVLNLRPNHLDHHETLDAYRAAKERIFRTQAERDWVLLNDDDPEARAMAGRASSRVLRYSLDRPVAVGGFRSEDRLVVRLSATAAEPARRQAAEGVACRLGDIRLRGAHNASNVLAACTLAGLTGVPPEAMAPVVRAFSGVAHRLEHVATVAGVAYYNDSIATAPDRTAAALESFAEPVVLIAGGSDKGLSYELLADKAERLRALVVLGDTGDRIAEVFRRARPSLAVARAPDLDAAVRLAADYAAAGDVVLLSPASASYDMFRNFEERGERFRRGVEELAQDLPPAGGA